MPGLDHATDRAPRHSVQRLVRRFNASSHNLATQRPQSRRSSATRSSPIHHPLTPTPNPAVVGIVNPRPVLIIPPPIDIQIPDQLRVLILVENLARQVGDRDFPNARAFVLRIGRLRFDWQSENIPSTWGGRPLCLIGARCGRSATG